MTRLSRLSSLQVFLIGAAATVLLAVGLAIAIDPASDNQLKIFGSFWASGWAASHGLDPYAIHSLTWITDLGIAEANMNPPTLLPLFQFFALFDAVAGARVWTLFSALLFIATAAALLADQRFACDRHQVAWVFLAPPLMSTLSLGQIYVLLFALGVGAWLLLKRNQGLAAGVLIGLLVAMKPNFAVWPALLFLCGHWRPAVSAGAAAAAVAALSLGLYGPEVYDQWLAAVAADRHILFATEVSITGYLTRLGLPGLALPVVATLLLAVAIWSWRRRFNVLDASALGIVVAILASPLAWVDYGLVLVPALLQRPWNRTFKIAAAMLVVPPVIPFLSMYGPRWTVALGGALYFGAFCLLLAGFVARLSGEDTLRRWRVRAARILRPLATPARG